MRAVVILAAAALILLEFVAFLVWLIKEPPPYHESED